MQKPKKVAVIGLDCALTHLIKRHIEEGHLPTFKKLFENGAVAENGLVPYPTVTPPNWATIGTGAWPGTHQVSYFHVQKPGLIPTAANSVAAFSSERVKAQYIWDALDAAGKKCIVLNYPGSWPSHMKNGIMVGGEGLSVGEHRDGMDALDSEIDICHAMLVTTGLYPQAIRAEFSAAKGWQGAGELGEDPLEMNFELNFPDALRPLAPTTWHALVTESGDEGYDTVTFGPSKELSQAFCTLKQGQWSPKIKTQIGLAEGGEVEVEFRAKLIELSDDADDFRLLITDLAATSGWSDPPEVARQIDSSEGIAGHSGGLLGMIVGWYDQDTYVEINDMHATWLADCATQLMANHEWDLFYMHSHPPDWAYHGIMTDMDEASQPDAAKRERAWKTHLGIYQTQDRMIARIMEAAGEDTLFVLVSDHGATPDGPYFNPYDALIPAGLAAGSDSGKTGLKMELPEELGTMATQLKSRSFQVDPARSKAIPSRSLYIYVNLKERYAEGIVETEDYEKVQREIIDCLYNWVDPSTGKRPIALALSKQDARILGLYGEAVGDVIYALYPEFGSQHGNILPAAEYGVGSLKALFTFTGPGVKKGLALERNAWITDLVPTICYLMGWPVPTEVDGAVLYQIFEDPDFKRGEVEALKERLAAMEKQLG